MASVKATDRRESRLNVTSQGGTLPAGQEISISTVTILQPMFGEPGTERCSGPNFWAMFS